MAISTNIIRYRNDLEREEHERLWELASFSDESRGRVRAEEPDAFRTCYQRDRDRILHSKAFRRLSHKTQVFLAAVDDHYRTRLSHTLEVSQISRTIARGLRLNEDLTEAIALGHDLGHTPFGHMGEDAISECLAKHLDLSPEPPLFQHNEHSLRVVDVLENDGAGLNLTQEVRNGILHHTGERPFTLEGCIVAISDRIAYVNHDIDDAIRAGVIAEADLPKSTLEVLGRTHSKRITTLVTAMITRSAREGEIWMEQEVWDAMMELRAYLTTNVYGSAVTKQQEPLAYKMVCELFEYFAANPEQIPSDVMRIANDNVLLATSDYVASMTDRYAIHMYNQLIDES